MQTNFIRVRRGLIVSGLALLLLALAGCGGEKPDAYSITIPNLKISDQEAIASFELNIKGGTVQIASSLPVGWDFTVQNEVGYNSTIKASSRLGSASLSLDELKRVVFTVRRNQASGASFAIDGTFVMTGAAQKLRRLAVTTGDFTLTGA